MSNVDGIEIECEDTDFEKRIIEAINLLQKDPEGYNVVKNNLDKIKQHDASYVIPGVSPITFYISHFTVFPPYYDNNNGLIWCASTIAHDAYHSKLYKESPHKAIDDYTGRDAELKCCKFQLKVCEGIKASNDIISYMNDLVTGIDKGKVDYWSDPKRGYAIRDSTVLIALVENGTVDYWSNEKMRYAISLSQCIRP
jgi:hypothetical protein